MSAKRFSVATPIGLIAVLEGFIILAGCGGGSSSSTTTTSTGTPTASLSATTLTFSSGVNVTSAAQTVTITNSGTATLAFTGFSPASNGSPFATTNTCGTGITAGGTCTVNVTFTPTATGTVNGTLTITDDASPTTQMVSLTGTGISASAAPSTLTFSDVTVGTTSAPQTVTLTNSATVALAVTSVSAAAPFSVSSNTCGTSVGANGSCAIGVTFAPTVAGVITGTLTIVDAAGTQTVGLTGSNTFANAVPVTVSFGPNGYLGPPAATSTSETLSYYNGIFTSVTVCSPGSTTNCATIPNVLVDTGSVGLRVLSNLLVTSNGTAITLPQVNDPSTGYPMYECVQYGDLSYTWGPMQMATVQIGLETASQLPGAGANTGIPIQVISAGVTPPEYLDQSGEPANPCLINTASDTLDTSASFNDDTVETLGANGILGVGTFPQDCGSDCTSTGDTNAVNLWPYLICETAGSSTCALQYAPLTNQAWNPVAAFPADSNGVSISLPAIPSAGQATVIGTLTFGIGTESNNSLNGATAYELDDFGNFQSATLNGVTYTSTNSNGTFIDSGSNALYVSDATTLGATDCVVDTYDIGLYCPSSPLSLQLGLAGSNSTSTTVSLNIANALNLFSANTTFAAFNNLGGDSGIDPTTDYFDLGLPFFFGQPHGIFVGIAGATTGTPNFANGYWAF